MTKYYLVMYIQSKTEMVFLVDENGNMLEKNRKVIGPQKTLDTLLETIRYHRPDVNIDKEIHFIATLEVLEKVKLKYMPSKYIIPATGIGVEIRKNI